MSSKLRLAACIKIRNKSEEFAKLSSSLEEDKTMPKVANILSRINPTSFRNTGLAQLKGLGVQGAIVGAAQHYMPGSSEAAMRALSGEMPGLGSAFAKDLSSNISANVYGSMGRAGHTIMNAGKNEIARQGTIRDALAKNMLSVDQLADNVTRYVPIKEHGRYFSQLESDLGKDVMARYRGAFVL